MSFYHINQLDEYQSNLNSVSFCVEFLKLLDIQHLIIFFSIHRKIFIHFLHLQILLENLRSTLEELESINPTSSAWALGKRHIFLSEGARQQLELLRNAKREYAAIVIQTTWRGWNERKKWPSIKNCLLTKAHSPRMTTNHQPNGHSMIMQSDHLDTSYVHHHHSQHHLNTIHNEPSSLSHHTTASLGALNKPRPQPISGTPPLDSCDQRIVAKTCSLFGLDLVDTYSSSIFFS